MSIKDELQHVKVELSSDEKILESAFKLERVYKKYKKLIWGLVILAILGIGGSMGWKAYQQNTLLAANDAFLTLQKDPGNAEALAVLKAKNPELFSLFQLQEALKKKSAAQLKALENTRDPVVSDIAKYHAALLEGKVVDSVYYHDMAVIIEAYDDLKAGRKSEAKSKLSLIAETSPLAKIARLLKHATIELK